MENAGLDKLAELRNRIHIQNVKRFKPSREYEAFAYAQQMLAEKTLEAVICRLATDYNRKQEDHVRGFTLPWDSRLE